MKRKSNETDCYDQLKNTSPYDIEQPLPDVIVLDPKERPTKKQKLSSNSETTSSSVSKEETTIEEYSTDIQKIEAIGRISWMEYELSRSGVCIPFLRYNSNKKIDSVQLDFDQDNEELKIRHDHSECPEFWMETRISLQDLKILLNENGFYLGSKK